MTGLGGTSVNVAWATPCASAECRVTTAALRAENDCLRSELRDARRLAEQLTDRLAMYAREDAQADARNIRRGGFRAWPEESEA